MNRKEQKKAILKTVPLTSHQWGDFEELFGKHGAYGGCWCMWWRITRSQFEEQQGEGNRVAMKAIVDSGEIPGLLFYLAEKAVGWCSIAPRDNYASLNRSRILKKIDNSPVWSLVCFYVKKNYRGQGLLREMLQGAIEYGRKQGAKIIEAYPTIPKAEPLPPVSSYMGLPSLFERAGFVEVARPSKSKMIMRYTLD